MTKVLLAWELGGGQGHIHRLAAVARALTQYGIEPVFVWKEFTLRGLEFPWRVVQAPTLIHHPLPGIIDEPCLYSDILWMFGFGEPQILKLYVEAWQRIIAEIKPDCIVADYAPALVLAAHNRVPTIVVGTGFSVPPQVEKFPSFRPYSIESSSERERIVVESVFEATGITKSLGSLFNGDRSFIFSIPELDCYYAHRTECEYIGSYNAPIESVGSPSGDIWAYLSQESYYYSLVMDTLKAQSYFEPLGHALISKSLAIHHGGIGTTLTCLLAGIPQLLLPKYQEQELTAYTVEKMGGAICLEYPTLWDLEAVKLQIPIIFNEAQIQARKFLSWNQNYLHKITEHCVVASGLAWR